MACYRIGMTGGEQGNLKYGVDVGLTGMHKLALFTAGRQIPEQTGYI